MSVYTGPRFIIPFTSSYSSSFIGLEGQDIKENLSDFIWGWTVGLTIRSGKTMIDFEYESGISNISRGFEGTCPQRGNLFKNMRLESIQANMFIIYMS